ncbi:MAG: hypothetical protein V4677_07515 [Bacteroidota bacterium]
MKKLSIKDVIEFKRKSEQSKKTFVNNLKLDKKKVEAEAGGDYWVISTSAISNVYRSNDLQIIKDKIDEVEEKIESTENVQVKAMYQKNINILKSFENFDFKKWYPSKKMNLIKTKKANSLLTIKGLEVQALPHHVFTYKKNDIEEIGAIWFIAKINGYKKDELGMFADMLYKYLKVNFSKDYLINPKYCIAVDIVKIQDINYSQIQKVEIPELLTPTLDEIKKLL